jgi:hypothetical protein
MSSFPAQAILDALDGIAYIVDPQGRIAAFGQKRWDRFAEENGARELIGAEHVIGRPLFDFVTGAEVQESYRLYMAGLQRDPTESVTFSFRCDGPSVMRELHMAITALHDGASLQGFLFHSVPLFENYRPALNIYDFKAIRQALRTDAKRPILAVCSYCLRLRHPPGSTEHDGAWIAAEEYYRQGGTSDVRLSHGICPECYDTRVLPNARQ